MTIEMANRLVELRRKNGHSQEELAARLGISRQAVSKWERGEASPDTDNLIALARLYGASLDELVLCDGETEKKALPSQELDADVDARQMPDVPDENEICDAQANGKLSRNLWYAFPFPVLVVIVFLLLGFLGGWWHPGWIVFLTIPAYYAIVDAAEKKRPLLNGAYPILMAIAFLLLGACGGWWHPGWLVFLTIPLYYGISNILKDGE